MEESRSRVPGGNAGGAGGAPGGYSGATTRDDGPSGDGGAKVAQCGRRRPEARDDVPEIDGIAGARPRARPSGTGTSEQCAGARGGKGCRCGAGAERGGSRGESSRSAGVRGSGAGGPSEIVF